jgi:hypothetical protein
MKKLSILTCTMIALGFMATTVRAQSPHFINCSASGVNSDGTLNVCFKLAGLGSTPQQVTVTASAHANATWACRTNGGQCPNAANKVNVQSNVSASGTFQSGKNGPVADCLIVYPPSTTLTCPPGQTLVLVSVSYTNVKVSTSNAVDCYTSPGTFPANFYPQCP